MEECSILLSFNAKLASRTPVSSARLPPRGVGSEILLRGGIHAVLGIPDEEDGLHGLAFVVLQPGTPVLLQTRGSASTR